MSKFLAVETSTHTLSVALQVDDSIFVRQEHAPKRHGELLLPWIDELCTQANIRIRDLEALFCGVGPGGFTGVRLGVGVVQAIASVHNLPSVGVSSLQVLAQSAADEFGVDRVISAVDARMGEVYWGSFVRDSAHLQLMVHDIEDQLHAPAWVDVPDEGPWLIVGDAYFAYGEALAARLASVEYEVREGAVPQASALLKLGRAALASGGAVAPEQLLPVYLRGENAWKKQSSS